LVATRKNPSPRGGKGGGRGYKKSYGGKGRGNSGSKFISLRSHEVNEVQRGDELEEEERDWDQYDEDEQSEEDVGSPSEDEEADEEEEWPAELINAAKEAEAFMTQAKKQRSEVDKARGFFNQFGGDAEEKSDRINKLKARLP
jgi:hypothetical protein